jgi:flagellar biosynthesis GTPase FlhF
MCKREVVKRERRAEGGVCFCFSRHKRKDVATSLRLGHFDGQFLHIFHHMRSDRAKENRLVFRAHQLGMLLLAVAETPNKERKEKEKRNPHQTDKQSIKQSINNIIKSSINLSTTNSNQSNQSINQSIKQSNNQINQSNNQINSINSIKSINQSINQSIKQPNQINQINQSTQPTQSIHITSNHTPPLLPHHAVPLLDKLATKAITLQPHCLPMSCAQRSAGPRHVSLAALEPAARSEL